MILSIMIILKNKWSCLEYVSIHQKKYEDYQLEFNFENWPDGCLIVHFKNEKVIASSIDD